MVLAELLCKKNPKIPETKTLKVITIYEMKPPRRTDYSFLPQELAKYPEETRNQIRLYTMAINKVLNDPAEKPLPGEKEEEYKMALLTYCFHLGLGKHSAYAEISSTEDTAKELSIEDRECRRLLDSLRTSRLEKAVDDLEKMIIPIDKFRKKIDHRVKSLKNRTPDITTGEIAKMFNISLSEAKRSLERTKRRLEGRGHHSIGKKAAISQS